MGDALGAERRSVPWVDRGGIALFLFTLLCSAGCIDTDALRTRAAFDLRCEAKDLELVELNRGANAPGVGSVYGVTGCGRRATYVYDDKHTWLMNSDEHSDDHESESKPVTSGPAKLESHEERTGDADYTQCNKAYLHVDDLISLWADWYNGNPVAKPPDVSPFNRACIALSEEAQLCLVAAYAKAHRDSCLARLQAYPETRARLDQMLLDRK
jgi:hypothetical protein